MLHRQDVPTERGGYSVNACAMTNELDRAEQKVEDRSAPLKKELGLRDLVLTQILFIVGSSWVGTAAKLGQSHLVFWLLAILLFYIPQAAVVIYSMTTSTSEDAPRGMEFLYNLNRFNVATSRARCACIVVGSPRLFAPECHTPRQMELANILCRYAELSRTV